MATFYNAEGASYSTDDPAEILRLTLSRGHYSQPPSKMTAAELTGDDVASFHPADHNLTEVVAKLDEVGRESPEGLRIVAEEKAGQKRKGVLGDTSSASADPAP